ncbi:MAG: hypothetical protein IPM85_01895 [Chitinophagaceae bacterium]|nr:hypothetical protein [Chitinophagaceae bacterium]
MYRLNLHTKNIIMLLFVVLVSLQVSYNQPGQTKQPATNSKTNQTAMASPNNEVTILKTVQPRFYVKQKEEQNISFTAYVQDPDLVNPTNIRQTPGGEVITELEKGSDYMVEIVGQKNGWFKISRVDVFDNNAIDVPGQFGWMHYSVLAVRTRNYANQKLNVYASPDKTSKIAGIIKEETEVRFTKFNKGYVFIRFTDNKGKKVEGWIEKEWLCGNPVTNCS